MSKVQQFTLAKTNAADCKDADCASTTWTFSTIDGERTITREVRIGCNDDELQVSEEGDYASWSYDPVAQQLVVMPYFEAGIFRYSVAPGANGTVQLTTWASTN